MNKSSDPLLSCIVLATSNSGPFLPSITLLNCTKSNSAPWSNKAWASVANSVADIFLLVPSGMFTITLLFDWASVSSKSNTLAFFLFLEYLILLLALAIALSALLFFATTFLASGLNVSFSLLVTSLLNNASSFISLNVLLPENKSFIKVFCNSTGTSFVSKKYSAKVCLVGIYIMLDKSIPASLNLIVDSKPWSNFNLPSK